MLYDTFSKAALLNPDPVAEGDGEDEGEWIYNNSEVNHNLQKLGASEREQQNKLLAAFNTPSPSAAAAAGSGSGSGSAAAPAPNKQSGAGAAMVIIGDAKSSKETAAQTQQKIHSLFDSLPDPNPQFAAALAASKQQQNGGSGSGAAAAAGAFDDADEDDDATMS